MEDYDKGVLDAAKFLDKMADDYADEFSGSPDPETGATEFKNPSQEELYNLLRELADSIRSLI